MRVVQLAGSAFPALQLDPRQRSLPLPVSFEAAVEQLERLPRMFIEPDGSFVWVGQQDRQPWQIDGCLFDRGRHVMYVDLTGGCPSEQFDQLLSTLGWPDSPLIFQLSQQAVFLSEPDFRRYVSGP